MAKLLVVYHTQSGNTETLAKAVEEGARQAGAEVVCKLASNLGLKEKVEPLLIQGKPDEAGLEEGREFGRKLVD